MNRLRHAVMQRLRRTTSALRGLGRRLRDESGSALIELALTMSLIGVPLLLATVHFSLLLIDATIISNAAHAGAEYGMISTTTASDTSYIITAAQNDASGLGTTLNVSPTTFFACSNDIGGTQYTTQSAATSGCLSGHALQFIQVVASATVTPALSVPGLAKSITLSSTSIMEVQE
ncbi:MAG TPA: TadE/TadG family type IV pilus assembly protein [Acidobacteriaceae bacterium]|nr:TadE/TadG family type IV pilus assembly protein [Acidobacteriaceae bacterium]